MAYTKNTWADGDIVTSEKLNHMEDGIANSGGMMIINDNNGTLDKTWQEIYDAMAQGKLCVVRADYGTLEDGITTDLVHDVHATPDGRYTINIDAVVFSASSATGYPKYYQSGGDIS